MSVSLVYCSPIGLVKGFTLQERYSVSLADIKGCSASTMCWNSPNSCLIGTRNGSVFQQNINIPMYSKVIDACDASLVALIPEDETLLAVSEAGHVRTYNRSSFLQQSDVEVRKPVSAARYLRPFLAVGGKENNLSIWNVERPEEPIFLAKNVRPTTLQLQVPVWISDICFVPGYDGRIILTTSRHGELALYDIRCGQRRPVSRHAWRVSRKHGKIKVGTGRHAAVIPDLRCTRPITRGLAFADAPGVGVRVVAGNVIGDLCFLDMRIPKQLVNVVSCSGENNVDIIGQPIPGSIKSRGARAAEAPVGVRALLGASGSITGLACGGVGYANFPAVSANSLFDSQPMLVSSSLDRYLRVYNRDTGARLVKLYAKVPVTSFLISDTADFANVAQLSEDGVAKETTGSRQEKEASVSSGDEEFDELWNRMEPAEDDSCSHGPPTKKRLNKK